MRKKLFAMLLILVCNSFHVAQDQHKLFSKELFQRHINFLGSDLFEGRAPGTTGGNLAAKYLAIEFGRLYLKPLGSNNSYYQNIPFHSSKPNTNSSLTVILDDTSKELKLNKDFLFYKTGELTFNNTSLNVVFVGYGIVAPEYDYNDYQDIDVTDKVVAFIEGEPESNEPTYFDGIKPTVYSSPEAKQRIALAHGAKGTILIHKRKADTEKFWADLVQSYSFPALSLASSPSSSVNVIINPSLSDLLFRDSGYSFDDVLTMCTNHNIRSFPLRIKLSFKGEFIQQDFISPNMVGMIEGSDPILKNTYVLISAHYDHLGIGNPVMGDSIYNGVFDNAVGVAALLEIARVFSDKKYLSKRSLIFLLTTAEESGLLGSYYYTVNPAKPLYQTIANINIDGIAALDNFKSIIAVGHELSTLSQVVKQITDERNLSLAEIPEPFLKYGAFSKSDQYSFAQSGIPSILLLEGPDYVHITKEFGLDYLIDYSGNKYHTPFDDLYQTINYDAVFQHIEIILAAINNISNSETEPDWNPGSPFNYARQLSRAEKR